MIPGILNISKLLGAGDIMWTKNSPMKYRKLSQEFLGLLCISAAISGVFYSFLTVTVRSIAAGYYTKQGFSSYEVTMQVINITPWIGSISLGAAVFLFLFLFLFLTSQKLIYLDHIIQGVEMLRTNHMDHTVPLEGNNEFTRLAESINYLAKVETELKEKEKKLQEEREILIRSLSHDIRTPLTSIMAYSEFLSKKSQDYPPEIKDYLTLMHKKGMQIKILTNQLLDRSEQELIFIENGRMFIEQLTYDFEELVGEDYPCDIDLTNCPTFQGEFCIQDFQRISDNLISNIHKYAEEGVPLILKVYEEDGRLVLRQKNQKKTLPSNIESYNLGLESIRRIAENFGGGIEIFNEEDSFEIVIRLLEIPSFL